jgi:hypothetical protein
MRVEIEEELSRFPSADVSPTAQGGLSQSVPGSAGSVSCTCGAPCGFVIALPDPEEPLLEVCSFECAEEAVLYSLGKYFLQGPINCDE